MGRRALPMQPPTAGLHGEVKENIVLSPRIISRYQTETLANLRSMGMLTLGVMQQAHGLSMRAVHEGSGRSAVKAFPVLIEDAGSGVDGMRELCHDSMYLVSSYLIDLVKVFETQCALAHRCFHASLHEAHHWAPREMDIVVSALDLALDAAESTSENLADAAVLVAKRLGDEAEVFSPPVRTMEATAQAAKG